MRPLWTAPGVVPVNPKPGTTELVRVEFDRVMVIDDQAPMTARAAEHPEHGLHERLQRLAVPRTGSGYTVRVVHANSGVRVLVWNERRQTNERASSGVTRAVMGWYVTQLQRGKAEAGAAGQARLAAHLAEQENAE